MSNSRNIIDFPNKRNASQRVFSRIALAGIAAFVLTLASAFILDGMAGDVSSITGVPRVIDGDTLDVEGQRIRIHGIDAPESKQTCVRGGVEWLCGQEAAKSMRALVNGSQVKCDAIDKDRYGRIVGKCFANGIDVGEALVLDGLALAYRQYSADYIQAEASAKAAGRGLWAGQFVEPWDWRKGKRLAKAPANDNAICAIKGNVSSKGERIYHVPGGQYYDRTRIDASKGEMLFCSENEAREAGWRKSKR